MKRFLLWCRKPYLRIHFAEPEIHRLAEEAVVCAKNATATAQQALELYNSVSRDLAKVREEVTAYVCSSMEGEAQVAELKRLEDRSRATPEEA